MNAELSTCALCPRLCRPACPVATGSAREAAVPTFLARMAIEFERGMVDAELAEAALTLCTDCGACEAHCHVGHPLPELLRRARRKVAVERPFEPLQVIDGSGTYVVVEADERALGDVVERLTGGPVGRWRTADRLGVGSIDCASWSQRQSQLRERASGLKLVVVDGGVARALESAGVSFTWLSELTNSDEPCTGSCATGGERPLACCGGGGPLARHHPEDAARVAQAFARRWNGAVLEDARCRHHLRASGVEADDLLDKLLEVT